MIQEFLGGGLEEARNKIVIAGALSSSSSLSSSPSSPAAPLMSEQQNLKCPRCDSTNTKFCYYNNYNLTQPRHFCKTCRRYWTKGGALRNVPIGGGCRKVKGGAAAVCRSTKARSASVIKSSLVPHGLDQDLSSNQMFFPSPSNSHLLSLLRSNPNPNPNATRIKEEMNLNLAHLVPDASLLRNALNARTLGFDYISQVPLWVNSQNQEGGLLLGDTAATGIQEIYQRMRSNGPYLSDRHPSSMISSSFPPAAAVSASSVPESAAMVGGEFGYWSTPFAWADMPTMNGSFP